MMLVSLIYVLIASSANGYTKEKSYIIIWMCVFKAVDAIEDVWLGLYQQKERLDIAGKCMTIRMILTIIVFAVSLIIFRALLPALIVATFFTASESILNTIAVVYVIVSVAALFMSPIFVKKFAIMGAAVLYMVLMILLCVMFAVPILSNMKR